MRTTLDLDEDVLLAVKEVAALEGKTAGKAASDLLRRSLTTSPRPTRLRNGVPLLPARPGAGVVTLEMVNRLRDE
jgi:hypothetical protein